MPSHQLVFIDRVIAALVILRFQLRRQAARPGLSRAPHRKSNGPCREYLRRRGIRYAIPEKTDSLTARLRKGSAAGGGRPASTRSGTRHPTPSNGLSIG